MKAFFSPFPRFSLIAPGTIVLVVAFQLFSSCEKKDPPKPAEPVNTSIQSGLPEEKRAIHAYMYISFKKDPYQNYGRLNAYASFADPARNLMSQYDKIDDFDNFNGGPRANVSVGSVRLNGMTLQSQTSGNAVTYKLNSNNMTDPKSVNWTTVGNGSFLPIEIQVPQRLPVFWVSVASTHTIYTNSDFTLDPKSFIVDFDSVAVRINNKEVHVAAVDGPIIFPKGTLSNLYNSTNVEFVASNYHHMIVNDKLYIFELCRKVNELLVVK